MPSIAQIEALRKQQNLDRQNAAILAALIEARIVAQNTLFTALSDAQKKQANELLLAEANEEEFAPASTAKVVTPEEKQEKSLEKTIQEFLVNFNKDVQAVLAEHNKAVDDLMEESDAYDKDEYIKNLQKGVIEHQAPTVMTLEESQRAEALEKTIQVPKPTNTATPPVTIEHLEAIYDLKRQLASDYIRALVLKPKYVKNEKMAQRFMDILELSGGKLEQKLSQRLNEASPEVREVLGAFGLDYLKHARGEGSDNYVMGSSAILNQYDTALAAQKVNMPTHAIPTVRPGFGGRSRSEEEEDANKVGYSAPIAPTKPHFPAGGRSGSGL